MFEHTQTNEGKMRFDLKDHLKHLYNFLILIRFHSSKSKPQNPLEIPEDSIEVQVKKDLGVMN